MIKCSCTSKRRRCMKKSRRKIISSVAHHPSVSVPRVAAVGAPPIVAGHQGVDTDLLAFASLHLEAVGIAPDIVPGLNAVAADIASTKELQDGAEPGHSRGWCGGCGHLITSIEAVSSRAMRRTVRGILSWWRSNVGLALSKSKMAVIWCRLLRLSVISRAKLRRASCTLLLWLLYQVLLWTRIIVPLRLWC
jgi:hypothetical protein